MALPRAGVDLRPRGYGKGSIWSWRYVCLWLNPDVPDVPKVGPLYLQLRTFCLLQEGLGLQYFLIFFSRVTDPERSTAKPDLPPTPCAPEKPHESWQYGFIFKALAGFGLCSQNPLDRLLSRYTACLICVYFSLL